MISKPATPITLRTLGKRQRVLLLAARPELYCATESDRQSALRLHEMGLLDRGRTSRSYWITAKGEAICNG